MTQYSTKYFGNIVIDETNDYEFFSVNYKDKKISILLDECNFGNKLEVCLKNFDKYFEINETAKRAIISNFPNNKNILEKIEYPDFYFRNRDGKIELSVCYKFSEKTPIDALSVIMDEELNILGFSDELVV